MNISNTLRSENDGKVFRIPALRAALLRFEGAISIRKMKTTSVLSATIPTMKRTISSSSALYSSFRSVMLLLT